MSSSQTGAPAATGGAGANQWLTAVLVALATFMEILDTTIANVALRYIAGGLGVSVGEASWVVTTYLVANAIILTASAFLAKTIGRKRFFLICLALFTASSVLCGIAWTLQTLLLFRIMQGLAGGGMVPVASSILVDAFPPEKRGQAFAVFGVAVAVAPVVGPTLGGWLSDNVSWHWAFLINGPVGVVTLALIALVVSPRFSMRQREDSSNSRFRRKARGLVALERGCRRRLARSARCVCHDTQLSLIRSAQLQGSSSISWSRRRRLLRVLGLDQAHDLFGRQPFDLPRLQPEFRQDSSAVFADARRRPLNSCGGTLKTGGRNGLADWANIRMVQLDDEFARHHLLVSDHLIAPQHWR
jgi:MFS family permease